MNSSQHHPDSAAEEQAALWAARLDGDTLDHAQRAELDAWLAEKPAHRALLSQYCQFSADLEERLPALVAAGTVAMPAPAKPARRGWTFPRLSVVALAAAAIAVAFVALRPVPRVENYAMASAQRGAYTLGDGTRVELNANTSLRFDNHKNERRVRLAGGEALFTVTKDPSRPFFVDTPTGSVRVTGTIFNVRTEPASGQFEVTVVEGSVQVYPGSVAGAAPSPSEVLGAGEQFSRLIESGSKHALSESEVDDALAWRQGQIVFRDVPLREAVARFSHYHGRAIYVAPAVANERVGGRHSIDDLSGFLNALQIMLPVKAGFTDPSGAASVVPRTGS